MITKLLHDITQLGYNVQFCSDFEGMIRLEITLEHGNPDFYQHEHLSFPHEPTDAHMKKLNNSIRSSLENFLDSVKNGTVDQNCKL